MRIFLILAFSWLFAGDMMAEVSESSEKQVRVEGTLVEGGVVCPLLRTAEGELVPLMGISVDGYHLGTRMTLAGMFVRFSPCMQGQRTLQVQQVLSVEEP